MITKGDYVLVNNCEDERFIEREGQVIGIDETDYGKEATVSFGLGEARGILLSNLSNSPWTENEDWPERESTSEEISEDTVEVDGTEVEVDTDKYEKFDGAQGEVLYSFNHNGEKWAMVFLYQPYDRKKDFPTTDLQEI